MTTTSLNAITGSPPTSPRKRRPRVPVWGILLLAALLLLAAVPIALLAASNGSDTEERATSAENRSSAVASAAAPVASTIDELCRRGDALAAELAARGACAQAVKAKEVITEERAAPTARPAGVGAAQIQQMISDALADAPRPLTIEQVAAKAAEIYAAHDVSTPERIMAAVTAICANNACDGPAGKNATDAQVFAQVNAYCAGREDKCVGPRGERGEQGQQGQPGVSFLRQYFQRDANGACLSMVESFNPATNETTTASSPAGDAACPAPPPATPTSAITPGG